MGGPGRTAEVTQYTYDALGRVISAIDGTGRKVVYTYDAAGNRTRLSNGAEFQEIIPTGWSSSSTSGTTGLTTANALRDGDYGALASIHVTQSETNAWVKADLGSVKSVNHIDLAAAIGATVGATPDDTNDVAVEYSVDDSTWRKAATTASIAPGAARSIALGGVSLRYLRLRRSVAGRVGVGDLRLYSAAAANSPLIAEPDSITTSGAAVTFDPRGNDRDLDGHPFTITAAEDPPHGQAVVNGGASLTYTPDPGYLGADSFSYTVSDGHNGVATARVSVLVRPSTNHPPVGVNDQFSVSDRATAIVDGINLLRPLGNDYDADGDVLTISGHSNPTHGTATLVGGKALEYQPTVGYAGADTFSYTLSDGRGGSATATVSLTLANTPPIAATDAVAVSAGFPVTFDPRQNDSDPNGDALTVTGISAAARGTAVLNANQTITYTPASGSVGLDGFTYALSDGRGGAATGRVDVGISGNRAPVAVGESLSTASAITFDPRLNDTDPDGDPLKVISVTAPSNGTAVVASAGDALTYTPNVGYTGADSFFYTVSDEEGATATAVVAINGLSAEYLVVAGGGGGGSSNGGGGGGGGLLKGQRAVDSSLSVVVGAGGAAGLNGQNSSLGSSIVAMGGGKAGTAGGSGGGSSGGGSGGGAGTPGQGHPGGDRIYPATGGGGGAGGPGRSAVNAGQSGAGGPGIESDISGALVSYGAGGGGGGSDYEDLAAAPGAAGGPSAGAGGGWGSVAAAAPASRGGGGGGGGHSPSQAGAGGSGVVIVRYKGAPKATGGTISQVAGYTIHTFTTVGTFQVTKTNSPPTAVGDTIYSPAGGEVTFDPRINDTDVDGDALRIGGVGAPAHGTATIVPGGYQITYRPTSGYTGADTFTYTLTDGQGHVAVATVSVSVQATGLMEYLVVGGGGGGGKSSGVAGGGGGGGGGGVLTGYAPLAANVYTVTIGAGGAGGGSFSGATSRGYSGTASALGSIATAIGGGGGGTSAEGPSSGSSGGGAAQPETQRPGEGLPPQGQQGGWAAASGPMSGAGGGGGATAAGGSALMSVSAGNGGMGKASSITGTSVVYGSGGGGGTVSTSFLAPGSGGPGAGDGLAGAAAANRGGGGGGGTGNTGAPGGDGGSGVVIVRYPGTPAASGGSITQVGGYTIHTFTASGAFTVP